MERFDVVRIRKTEPRAGPAANFGRRVLILGQGKSSTKTVQTWVIRATGAPPLERAGGNHPLKDGECEYSEKYLEEDYVDES